MNHRHFTIYCEGCGTRTGGCRCMSHANDGRREGYCPECQAKRKAPGEAAQPIEKLDELAPEGSVQPPTPPPSESQLVRHLVGERNKLDALVLHLIGALNKIAEEGDDRSHNIAREALKPESFKYPLAAPTPSNGVKAPVETPRAFRGVGNGITISSLMCACGRERQEHVLACPAPGAG